jgi:uncharacterized protein YqfA (UPF0365 family)
LRKRIFVQVKTPRKLASAGVSAGVGAERTGARVGAGVSAGVGAEREHRTVGGPGMQVKTLVLPQSLGPVAAAIPAISIAIRFTKSRGVEISLFLLPTLEYHIIARIFS